MEILIAFEQTGLIEGMVFSNMDLVAEPEVVAQSQTVAGDEDKAFMARALELARRAQAHGEVPVGAVVVQRNRIVGEGCNRPIAARDPAAHAEIEALRAAGQAVGAYRLPATTLYVTLEPCAMCVGALIHARVARLVFGARDPKTGACGGALHLIDHPSHNHRIAVCAEILAEPCSEILRAFFRNRRADGGKPSARP